MKIKILLCFLFGIHFLTTAQKKERWEVDHLTEDGIMVEVSLEWYPSSGGINFIVTNFRITYVAERGRANKLDHNEIGYSFPMNCSDCFIDLQGTAHFSGISQQKNFKGYFISSSKNNHVTINHTDGISLDSDDFEKQVRVDEASLKITKVGGFTHGMIRSAMKRYYAEKNSGSSGNSRTNNSANNSQPGSGQTGSSFSSNGGNKPNKNSSTKSQSFNNAGNQQNSTPRSPADIAQMRQDYLNSKKANKTSLDRENERKAFHQDHVRKNNEAYYQRQAAAKEREQVQKDQMENFRSEQQKKMLLALERRKAENERKQREFEAQMQARIKKAEIDRNKMQRAQDVAFQQMDNGNIMEGSKTLALEHARQGNEAAAYGTLALGFAGQVIKEVSEEKKRKEEVERRKLAEQRRQQEAARKRQALLDQQKREFNKMVENVRAEQKKVINSRKNFMGTKVNYTKTFDKFATENKPIYLFYVEADKSYADFKERVNFPETVEISIKESAELKFSPIIAVHPNSSGEYPFLKEILSEVKNTYFKKRNSEFKIYNWKNSLGEIETLYKAVSEKAMSSNFIPVYPKQEMLVSLNNQASESNPYWENNPQETLNASEKTTATNYWTQPSIETDSIRKNNVGNNVDYWEPETRNKDTIQKIKQKTSPVDYWNSTKDSTGKFHKTNNQNQN